MSGFGKEALFDLEVQREESPHGEQLRQRQLEK